MWVVLQLQKHVELDIYGQVHEVPLSFADGMIGALPVFHTKEEAENFANDVQIVEIELVNNS